jgi:dethiobiotin synthetase
VNPSELKGLFVTGTDTGVGKTRVAAAIARALRTEGRSVGVLKPAATGATRTENGEWHSEDAEHLIDAIGGGVPIERVAPLLYEEPLAPCVAARRRGEPLTAARLQQAVADALQLWCAQGAEVIVVEGVGGWLCPLAEGGTVADLAFALDFPVLLVALLGLGTLNHTLLTVESIQRRSLRIAGVILNSPEPATGSTAEATNPEELSRRLPPGVAILDQLPHGDDCALRARLCNMEWSERTSRPRMQRPG